MKRMNYKTLVAELAPLVAEAFPWDVEEALARGEEFLLLDIRCPSEFERMHIAGSLNVPRGILEAACDYGYEETEPALVEARERPILVICRSGNRSLLAGHTMQRMGYRHVVSLRTGLRGWNDYELPLVSSTGERVPLDEADAYFTPVIDPAKLGPSFAPALAVA